MVKAILILLVVLIFLKILGNVLNVFIENYNRKQMEEFNKRHNDYLKTLKQRKNEQDTKKS